MSQFIKHSLTMFRGAVTAQVIPALLLPVISRLYGPEAFGIYAGVLGIATILSVFFALRLEVAIVLPESDQAGDDIARVACRIAGCMAFAFTIIFFVFQPFFAEILNMQRIGYWLAAAPLIALLITCLQTGVYTASRHRDYTAVASATVRAPLGAGCAAVLMGLAGFGAAGLIASRLAGQACGALRLRTHFPNLKQPVAIGPILRTYRKFPLFNMPYSLIGSFTREFLVLALTAFHFPAAAGFYGLARSAMLMPVSLVSTSLGQVFYREAARSIDHPDFIHFAYRLMLTTACLAAPVLSLFTIWDAQVFRIVFGPAWESAGLYASVFAVIAILAMLTSWPERVFEVRGKQEIPLMLQILFDGASIGCVLMALRDGHGPLTALMTFVAIQCVYHLSYLAFVFRFLHLNAVRYIALLGASILCGFAPYALHTALKPFISSSLPLFIAETTLIGALCLLGLWRAIKTLSHCQAFVGNS